MRSRNLAHEAGGWSALAPACSAFVLEHLPNRVDVWGGYLPPAKRAEGKKVYTAPAKDRRGIETLSANVLIRHFRALHGGNVIGLHTTSPENTSRWFGLDFDLHDGELDDVELQRARIKASFRWCVEVLGERFALLLEDSDGGSGRHVWGRFSSPVPTGDLYAYLTNVVDECARANGYRPEIFPKQPALGRRADGSQQMGNWLRLPGRHHTRGHWSRLAAPGATWGVGRGAAERLLHWEASDPAMVPPSAHVIEEPSPQRFGAVGIHREGMTRVDRIRNYVTKVPNGSDGSGRANNCFRLAAFLRNDVACSDQEALPILHAWNAGNTPPLPSQKVEMIWANAGVYGGRRAA